MTPLRRSREARNWSQREVEQLTEQQGLKVDQASLCRIEKSCRSRTDRKQTGATAAQAAVLAQVFGHELTEAQILYPADYLLPSREAASEAA